MTLQQAQQKLADLDAQSYNPSVKSYELDGEKITFNSAADYLKYRNFLVRIINSYNSGGSPFAEIAVSRSNPPYGY